MNIEDVHELMKTRRKQYRTLLRDDALKARHFPRILNVSHRKNGEDLKSFVLTVSTDAMLRLAAERAHTSTLATDATFKRIQNGYPIIVTGLISESKSLKVVSISVVLAESTESYKTVFKHVKDAVFDLTGTDLRPLYIMGDCASTITTAATALFPEARRLVCYAHVLKWLKHHIRYNYGVRSESEWVRFKFHVDKLFLANSIDEFRNRVNMIAGQFAGNERLREYLLGSDRVFDTESWKSKWFRGCYEDLSVLWQPRTNNATEGFNQKLKLEIFSNRILSFEDSLTKLLGDDVTRYSIEADSNWTDRIQYDDLHRVWRSSQARRESDFKRDPQSKHVLPNVTEIDGDVYWYGNYKTFMPADCSLLGVNPLRGGPACSCKQYARDFFCVHICACALLFRGQSVPSPGVPVTESRAPQTAQTIGRPSPSYGLYRPKKPKPALQRMN
jgi:hypothetical protein